MAKVEVEGGKKLVSKLKNIEKATENAIEQALLNSALMVERDAKIDAPVDTGRLRSSISHETEFGGENPSVTVGTNVSYAKIQEFGSSKQPAHPFLFPAYNNNKQKILKELAKAMRRGIGL